MLKIISNSGEWDIIIEGVQYNFYYSEVKPLQGLLLNGCDTQEEEYRIGNKVFTATKENYIFNEKGYRYILTIV